MCVWDGSSRAQWGQDKRGWLGPSFLLALTLSGGGCPSPHPSATSHQGMLRAGWQLLASSGTAKCGFLATRGIFLLFDQIWFLTASLPSVAPARVRPGRGTWPWLAAALRAGRGTELGGYSQGGSSIPGGAESCMVHIRGGVCPPGSSLVYLNESRALHPSWSHAVGRWDATSGCRVALGAMGLPRMAQGRFSLQGPGLGAGVLPMPPALTVPTGAVPAGCRWSST